MSKYWKQKTPVSDEEIVRFIYDAGGPIRVIEAAVRVARLHGGFFWPDLEQEIIDYLLDRVAPLMSDRGRNLLGGWVGNVTKMKGGG